MPICYLHLFTNCLQHLRSIINSYCLFNLLKCTKFCYLLKWWNMKYCPPLLDGLSVCALQHQKRPHFVYLLSMLIIITKLCLSVNVFFIRIFVILCAFLDKSILKAHQLWNWLRIKKLKDVLKTFSLSISFAASHYNIIQILNEFNCPLNLSIKSNLVKERWNRKEEKNLRNNFHQNINRKNCFISKKIIVEILIKELLNISRIFERSTNFY